MYRYQLFMPCKHESGWNAYGPVYRDGNLAAVKRWAFAALGLDFDSLYGARMHRRPFVRVERRLTEGTWESMPSIEQPVHIVPSVGDLGWTP